MSPETDAQPAPLPRDRVYDRRALTYANSFDNPLKSNTIRAIEWMTGKVTVIRLIRRFEQLGAIEPRDFWGTALRVMGITITTPPAQIAHIPPTGPVVFVANHPHGMVDGMVLGALIGQVRDDYRILTRSLLTDIDPTAANYLIPVPFPHQSDAQERMVEMRAAALEHLRAGGLVAVFPSGVVASSDSMFGPVIERDWNVFTAKLIRRSGATVVPMRFPGQNSRAYQIANKLSPMLRQGLLLHEVVKACNKPQAPIVGHPIPQSEIDARADDPRAFMAWLRAHTLALED